MLDNLSLFVYLICLNCLWVDSAPIEFIFNFNFGCVFFIVSTFSCVYYTGITKTQTPQQTESFWLFDIHLPLSVLIWFEVGRLLIFVSFCFCRWMKEENVIIFLFQNHTIHHSDEPDPFSNSDCRRFRVFRLTVRNK